MDANQKAFELYARKEGFNKFSMTLGRYDSPVIRRMFSTWEHLMGRVEDLEQKLKEARERNTSLVNQCRDHDTRRVAAVAQASALAEEVDRLQAMVETLMKEEPDPVESTG